MVERPVGGVPGWPEVLLVAAVIVGVVLGSAVLTGLLPADAQDFIFRTPIAIIILVVGTVGLLVSLARRPPAS